MKVAGFGFRTGASLASLQDALAAAGGAEGVTRIATVLDKAETPAFQSLSVALGVPIKSIAHDALVTAPVTTQSAKSQSLRGTGSVSEAAALVGAGEGAVILAKRSISRDKMATCAIAEGDKQ